MKILCIRRGAFHMRPGGYGIHPYEFCFAHKAKHHIFYYLLSFIYYLKNSFDMIVKECIFMISIAIDGPSGAGKSSLAKALAKDLGYVYVDTGAMYRSIGLYAVRAGVDPHDADAVAALLPKIRLDIRLLDGAQHIYLNGEDVSGAIRAENIGMAASAVAAHPAVRTFLLDTQRGLAASQNILMDGRDIGTVVLPNATVKIFLTASAEARAQRRAKELAEKGQPADFATVLADIQQRDYQDSHRAVAPLKQAADAILVDTSDIGLQESFDLLKRTILAHI